MPMLSVAEIRAIVGAEAECMTDEQVYERYLEVRAHAQMLVGILKGRHQRSAETSTVSRINKRGKAA